jgi:hypothetical protein
MHTPESSMRTPPVDQADGLRRLFASRTLRFVPVVSNPFIAFGGVLIERLCSALTGMQQQVLVVDAAERAPKPLELAHIDLADGIESLANGVSYLAAAGLPVRHADSRGSTRGFLDAVADAAPFAQVVLVHASALELARLFGRGDAVVPPPRPLLFCDDRPEGMTHAYTSMKLLATRAQWLSHDLLMCAAAGSPRAPQVAQRLSHCAENFLGGVLRAWVSVDPAEPAAAEPSAELARLVRELLAAAPPHTATEHSQYGGLPMPQSRF